MSRRNRVQYENAIYHVTSRGVRRQAIYRDDEDRQRFFDRCEEVVEKYGWLVHAIVLMTNHFHLFFKTPEPNLCRGMQFLLGGYAVGFNRRHALTGHVFQGRFFCGVIENESYSWNVSRYIHVNPYPVLVARPQLWPWSSYPGYVDSRLRLPWIQYDELLAAWQGATGGDPVATYRRFVESSLGLPCPSPFESAADGWILGSDAFADRIRGLVSPNSNEPSARRARVIAPVPLHRVIATVCDVCEVTTAELQVKRGHLDARSLVAHFGQTHSGATLAELAGVLGLSRRDSIPGLLRRLRSASCSGLLQRQLDQIKQRLEG